MKIPSTNTNQFNPLIFASTFNPCVMLWLAVITQAIEDARSPIEKKGGSARSWIFAPENEFEFKEVCGYAHLDYFWVREQAQRFIALPQLPIGRVA
jgi:hypothetical protein